MGYRDRKVLVAGSSGLTGMALTRRLVAEGACVRATVHQKEPAIRFPGVQYVPADLLQTEDCARVVEGVEVLFLVAARTSGAGITTKDPVSLLTPNILLNVRMLEAAYRARVFKVLWLGSTTAYPDTDGRPVREEELFQGDPHTAYFSIGWMNRYIETLCRMYSSKVPNPICVQVLRPTNIYGPYDNFSWEFSHVLPALMRKVVERQRPIQVWGNGEEIRDFLFVEDLVDACLSILEQSNGYDPVNIGLGRGYSVKDVLQILCEADGYTDAEIVFNSSKSGVITKRQVDTSKAKSCYGFMAKTDLPAGIEKTLRWYRDTFTMAKT